MGRAKDCECQERPNCNCECGHRVWTLDEWTGGRSLSLELTTYPGWTHYLDLKSRRHQLMWSIDVIHTGGIPDGTNLTITQAGNGINITAPVAITVTHLPGTAFLQPLGVGLVADGRIVDFDGTSFQLGLSGPLAGEIHTKKMFAGDYRRRGLAVNAGALGLGSTRLDPQLLGTCPTTLTVISQQAFLFRLAVRCICCDGSGWEWFSHREFCIKYGGIGSLPLHGNPPVEWAYTPSQFDNLHADRVCCGTTYLGRCAPNVVVFDSGSLGLQSGAEPNHLHWGQVDLARLHEIFGTDVSFWGNWRTGFMPPYGTDDHVDLSPYSLDRANVIWLGGYYTAGNGTQAGIDGDLQPLKDWLDTGHKVLVIDSLYVPQNPNTGDSIQTALGLAATLIGPAPFGTLSTGDIVPTSHPFCDGVSGNLVDFESEVFHAGYAGIPSGDVVGTSSLGDAIVAERWPGNTTSRVVLSTATKFSATGSPPNYGLSVYGNATMIRNFLDKRFAP